ncbi:UNVERIFIED_CONTAM: hypothetical protein PYX00_006441 [Menopon gallinae]|uniref:Uncharacterized protein n=1 Tax=Menopon gallinae TaxID=328185 RepID=A0AAW2HVC3_9NEOP
MCDGCEVNQKYYKHNIEDPEKERRILDSLCIPTQTEIRSQLGSKLADVFFENLTSEARIFLGLQPPLVGPSDVWINPNSRLKKKVRCEPIPEPQVLHQKALMHQTILEIGTSHIDDLKNQLRQEVEEAVRNQAINYEEEFEKRMALEIERVKLEAEVQCKQVVGTLMLHFDKCFADVVERHKLKMRKECQVKVLEERADLAAHMMSELQREIEKRDLELCSDFHDTLNGELNALERKFVKQIDAERKIAEEVIEGIVEKYEQMLVNVRAEMEMANTIDLCQAIAQENALREKEVREEKASHEDIIIQLVQRNNALQKKNETLQKMATERSKRIENYQKKMKGLLEEFQKFVNYALEATPAHAEYLLSTQKMVLKKYHEDGLVDPVRIPFPSFPIVV